MGGKNPFLGIAYIVVGGLCILLGAVFLATHLIKPRSAASMFMQKDLFADQLTGNLVITPISHGIMMFLARRPLLGVIRPAHKSPYCLVSLLFVALESPRSFSTLLNHDMARFLGHPVFNSGWRFGVLCRRRNQRLLLLVNASSYRKFLLYWELN